MLALSGALAVFSAYGQDSPEQSARSGQINVIGNIADENGDPLPGATIVLKGSNNEVHAIADIDGNYSITVPDRWAILTYSYIGFLTQDVQVGNRRVVNVTMTEDIGQLEDAMVVAYGQQRKESVVAAIAAIEPDKLKVSTSRSLSNNLAGTVAGILAVQRSGEPVKGSLAEPGGAAEYFQFCGQFFFELLGEVFLGAFRHRHQLGEGPHRQHGRLHLCFLDGIAARLLNEGFGECFARHVIKDVRTRRFLRCVVFFGGEILHFADSLHHGAGSVRDEGKRFRRAAAVFKRDRCSG